MIPLSLIAVLSHLCITALAAGPPKLPRPTLSSSISPRSPLTPLDSIDLVSPTRLHAGPPEVPWDLKVPNTNTYVQFIYFKRNRSGNDTEGLTCIRDAIAKARTHVSSALIGDILLTYDVGATSLQAIASRSLTWGTWLKTLLLLEHVTEIYADWQFLFDLYATGQTRRLGSGGLIEDPDRSATT